MTNFLGTFKLLYTAKEGISKMDDSSEKSALLKQRQRVGKYEFKIHGDRRIRSRTYLILETIQWKLSHEQIRGQNSC